MQFLDHTVTRFVRAGQTPGLATPVVRWLCPASRVRGSGAILPGLVEAVKYTT